ncbi:MAG: Rha family transcriptional regulator [Aeriscardovia sp.]|nr:Rha family transcriptional regulator [Aeriscardovia sp.]
MSKALVILSADKSTPLTSTEIIASALGKEHKDVIALAHRYKDELCAFGPCSFKTKMVGIGSGARRKKEISFLNESQATFLITLMRNSPEVVRFKVALVKAFFNMREKLRKAELEKLSLKAEKLEIKLQEVLRKKDGLSRSEQYQLSSAVNKKAIELGCPTACIWKRLYKKFQVPTYTMLKPAELPAALDEVKRINRAVSAVKPGRVVKIAPQIREAIKELSLFSEDEEFMYDLMDARELVIGTMEVAVDSARLNRILDSLTRLQQFFAKRRQECRFLPMLLPIESDRDNNYYVRACS